MTNDINFNAKSKTNPSIMEPVDETPSLTLKADLIDAINSDCEGDGFGKFDDDHTPTTSHYLNTVPEMYVTSLSEDVGDQHTKMPHLVNSAIPKTFGSTMHQLQDDLKSININYEKSFLLLDGREELRVPSAEIFTKRLGCGKDARVKVVSIFGNTGDGKSHTMNHVFFNGEDIYQTSAAQDSCTLGVWAAYQPALGILCLDTEGLLGTTTNENQRMRLLLKVLAISDIVIFRTRSERLHSDMFTFLGTASKAFCKHFATALQSIGLPGSATSLGPSVFIFHETRNTTVISSTVDKSPEDILRERFAQMEIGLDAFSSLRYVGIQTTHPPTNYKILQNVLNMEIENTTVRSPRSLEIVYKAIEALNLKFSGKITEKSFNPFPEQYFTCFVQCMSCEERCELSMGHISNRKDHHNSKCCRYQNQYENKVYLCKRCHLNGRKVVVRITTQASNEASWIGLARFAWSGSVIDCPNCGEIHRTRQYWYGNRAPEDCAVRPEIVHVWKDAYVNGGGPKHSAQMVVDGVNYLSETVYSIGSQPTKLVGNWIADKIAPSYWRQNFEIIHCHACKTNFERTGLHKHHCRGCGEGFCSPCSSNSIPVPARGWATPVRVCNSCFDILSRQKDACPDAVSSTTEHYNSPIDDQDVRVRKYGEVVYNSITSVASFLEYPKDLIKDQARPTYWVPDHEAVACSICQLPFGTAEELVTSTSMRSSTESDGRNSQPRETRSTPLPPPPPPLPQQQSVTDRRRHHCRSCGQGVCDNCSERRHPVPERGWPTDVRVCDDCYKKLTSE